MPENVPPPIRALVDATNAGDTDAFVALFAGDAYLNDFGREFTGPEGAASWNETDNIGMKSHFDLHAVRPGENEGDYLVDITVTSNRFNVDSTLDIGVRGDRITRLITG